MRQFHVGIAALCFGFLTACSAIDKQLAAPKPQGGIGGTGAPATQTVDGSPGGIGGTGIFGQITEFGSIIVNDLRVELPPDYQASLSIGSTVLVEAETIDGVLQARSIRTFQPIQGRIDARHGDRLDVMHTGVLIDEATRFFDQKGNTTSEDAMYLGQRIAVSGIWHPDGVAATRIDILSADAPSVIRGLLLPTDRGWRIANTKIDFPNRNSRQPGFVALQGSFTNNELTARLQLDEELFSEASTRLSVQAAIAPDPVGPGFHLSGIGIPVDFASELSVRVGEIAIFEGDFDGRFEIERMR